METHTTMAVLGLLALGCAAKCPEPATGVPFAGTAAPQPGMAESTALSGDAPDAKGADAPSGQQGQPSVPADEPTSPPAGPPAVAGDPPAGSLPEVVIENVGLHIGGGPNDDASRAPFRAAIEQRFDGFRRCYVHVEDPKKGGTFGVDLLIRRDGGKPDVRQPRTGMKGDEFRACLVREFESVQFERPPRGPTMISYSLRFKLEG